MAARKTIFLLPLLLAAFLAGSVHAQVIPDPSAGGQLYVRNVAGKIVERLYPNGQHYDVFDMLHQGTVLGYAQILGRRLIIYDRHDNVVATARAELLPPDSNLSVITVVRDRAGHPIGMLERH